MTTVLWCGATVPPVYDLLFTCTTGNLARFTGKLGPLLDSLAAFTLIGVATAAVIFQVQYPEEYSGWDYANDLVPQLQRLPRFLIMDKNDEEMAPVWMGILVGTDVTVGFASLVTQIGATVWDWQKVGAAHGVSRPAAMEASSGQQ